MSTKTPKRKRAATAVTANAVAATAVAATAVTEEPAAVAVAAAPLTDVASVQSVEAPAPVVAIVAEAVAAPAPQRAEPIVSLASNSTVKDAAALRDALLQVLDEPRTVAIDAKSVERIDTAIIQVLCAFISDRAERCLAVAWRSPPQPVYEAARLLGVGALLALPSQPAEA